MWPFASVPDKAGLQGLKVVKVNHSRYTIKRLNPLLDFDESNMPQVFTAYQSRRRKLPEAEQGDAAKATRAMREMYDVVKAGVVEPKLVPVGAGEMRGMEDGITVEDLFRDGTTGPQLYWEVLSHSLNRYKGVMGTVFFLLARLRQYMPSRPSTADSPAKLPSVPESVA